MASCTIRLEEHTGDQVVFDSVDCELERRIFKHVRSLTVTPVITQTAGGVQSGREVRILIPARDEDRHAVEVGGFRGLIEVLQPRRGFWRRLWQGMHLQCKKQAVSLAATGNLTFAGANPDTITRTSGSWIGDGVEAGDNITITGSASNNGTYTVASRIALVVTLVATDALANEGPVAATATCYRGFRRTLNTVVYGFNWRQFANDGTLAQAFQWIQRQLRRATDVDEASSSSRGDITALLQAFASPNTLTANLVMDNVAAADLNNLTEKDATGVSRNGAFMSSITISLNSNINDSASKKLNVYWTNSPNQFGTAAAVLVKDKDNTDMTAQDSQLNGAGISFSYNYDASQNGHGAGAEENFTLVCIGKDKAQYVKATGPVTKKNENTFSMVAPLERNYSNP